jgi:hypothetical protein
VSVQPLFVSGPQFHLQVRDADPDLFLGPVRAESGPMSAYCATKPSSTLRGPEIGLYSTLFLVIYNTILHLWRQSFQTVSLNCDLLSEQYFTIAVIAIIINITPEHISKKRDRFWRSLGIPITKIFYKI